MNKKMLVPPQSIVLYEFDQEYKGQNNHCGVSVNFFHIDDLLKAIERGAQELGMIDKVWLTGFLKR